jgi:hypothetical protein
MRGVTLGPILPFEDARQILVLHDEICDLFEKHLTPEKRGERDVYLFLLGAQ